MISKYNLINEELLADILSVSRRTIQQWISNKTIIPKKITQNKAFFCMNDLKHFNQINEMLSSKWDNEDVIPVRDFFCLELFAGAGGMALGFEKAGMKSVGLNEINKDACETLRTNRKNWNIIENDIKDIDFTKYNGIDFLSGGFPCQSFSYAGKKLGFEDTRGTLFFEFARAIKEINPKMFLAENVRGLLTHENGKTLDTIKSIINELGYHLIEPTVLKAIFYKVPQKRERLFLVGIRKDLLCYSNFEWPSKYHQIMTVKDALKKGELYSVDCPDSDGQKYPKRKKEILKLVPEGGSWKDLPLDIQKEYMKSSFFMGGGKTGMARRLSWDLPSLTLTCAPAQKQTERCHPEETRPLTIREYARIQTFPDDWIFKGSLSSQYKQIGNAVPVNLAFAVGRKIVKCLNSIEQKNINKIKKSKENQQEFEF